MPAQALSPPTHKIFRLTRAIEKNIKYQEDAIFFPLTIIGP
jgi:hypothetical protein